KAEDAVRGADTARLAGEVEALRRQAEDLREEAEALDKAREGGDMQRLQLVSALLTRSDGRWLATLLTQREFKGHVYHVSNQTARVAGMTEPGQLKDGLAGVLSLSATEKNDASLLGGAVRQVIKDFKGNSLSAVVMFTDGVTTEGEETLGQAAQAAAD